MISQRIDTDVLDVSGGKRVELFLGENLTLERNDCFSTPRSVHVCFTIPL